MKTTQLVVLAIALLLAPTLPAAASDYTLGVFGNANEDDTVNMQDVTYTELIILEYRDRTELADAKCDNKINMQDVTQIELLILGEEKEVTILDHADRIVTIEKPARIALGDCEAMCFFTMYYEKEGWDYDKIVGVPYLAPHIKIIYRKYIGDLPYCLKNYKVQTETTIEVNPDSFIVSSIILKEKNKEKLETLISDLDKLGIPLLILDFRDPETENLIRSYIMNTD